MLENMKRGLYDQRRVVVVRLFIGTQNRLVVLHSVLIKAHEETDISPHNIIYRPVGSTNQCFLKKKQTYL